MNHLPSTEARIAAQEVLSTIMHARIEQLSQDMSANFREVRQEMARGFEQAFVFVQERFDKIEQDIAELKATQADFKATQSEHGQKLDLIVQFLTEGRAK